MGKASRDRKEKHELRELAGYRTIFDWFMSQETEIEYNEHGPVMLGHSDWHCIDTIDVMQYCIETFADKMVNPRYWREIFTEPRLPFDRTAIRIQKPVADWTKKLPESESFIFIKETLLTFTPPLSSGGKGNWVVEWYGQNGRGDCFFECGDWMRLFWEQTQNEMQEYRNMFDPDDNFPSTLEDWIADVLGGFDPEEHNFSDFKVRSFLFDLFTALMTLQFLNMRNVELIDGPPPPPRIQALHQKHYGEPLYTYKVLSVGHPRKEYTEDGDYEHVTHATPRGHIVRGHPRRVEGHPFIPDGVYWIPAHTRGDFTKGEVFKDYRIVTPDEDRK